MTARMMNLSDLPTELLFLIADQLSRSDAAKWSSCSKLLRSCLASLVYETVAFENGQDSAGIALKAVKDYGPLVRKLVFSCVINADVHEDYWYPSRPGLLPTGEDDEETADSDDGEDLSLSAAAGSLLKGTHTPYASVLVIHIRLEYCSVESFDQFFEPMDDDIGGTLQAESMYSSRALMASVWDAVADNESIRTLEVPALMPKFVSTFETPKFIRFLGDLHSIDLTVFSAHGEDVPAMECTCYSYFLRELGRLFFRHTRGLRHLRLECASDGPMGLGNKYDYGDDDDDDDDDNDDGKDDDYCDLYHVPLPLPKRLVMPELISLKLSQCFICPELLTFIRQHQASLRSLHLNCVASARSHAAMTWEIFFTELADLKTGLSELVVDPWDPGYCDLYQPPDELFFTYAYLSEGSADMFLDGTFAKGRGRQARDRRAYATLKMLIGANRAGSGHATPEPWGSEDDASDYSNGEGDVGQYGDVLRS